jgi:AraC family transcriptional regulator
MPAELEKTLRFMPLYESPLVRVLDYRCTAPLSGPEHEEESGTNSITLMRHGAFCKHFGRKYVTADVNQAIFFSKASTYKVSHPADCGDRGTSFELSKRILNDIIRELDAEIDERPDTPFPFVTGPCDAGVFWRHRELVMRLERAENEPLEPLWADVTTLQLLADVLEAAFERHGAPRKTRRQTTDADHATRAEAAKTYMAENLSGQITLDEIAAAVYASPFNFSRIFQRQTGLPVHRYLTLLRLRASLENLAQGADDITTLALDLGFSSHSHFTDVFRREFGQTPSEVRQNANGKKLREMSKNLIV